MKITGRRIMELLGEKNLTRFVKTIFDPFRDGEDVLDRWRLLDKERSQLMSGKKTNSHSTFVTWAEIIQQQGVYQKLLGKISAYESQNADQIRAFRALFEEDKYDRSMPKKLAEKIEHDFESRSNSEAILLLLLWSIYREDISLLSFLYTDDAEPETPVQTAPDMVRLLPHRISANPIYVRHDSLLQDIHNQLLSGSHFVFLQGMGGVGKTESAKQYEKQYADCYDTVVFAECNSSLTELLIDNTVFTLTAPFISERLLNPDGMTESDAQFYHRKLAALRCAVGPRTLLVLDNVDTEDPVLPDFLTGICHVIVTTRWHSQAVYPDETIELDDSNNLQDSIEIFSKYYRQDIQGEPYAEKLIAYFSGHPLALELTAEQMRVSGITAKEMWEAVQQQNEKALEEGFLLPNKSRHAQSMAMHICQIFNVTDLSDTARYILSCLSLMPKSGLEKKYVRDFCELKSYKELNDLIGRSWLRELDGIISMHTLIKETVQLSLHLTMQSCMPFISNMMLEFSAMRCYHSDYAIKMKTYGIALHLYESYPEPTIETYSFYEWAELVFSHCDQILKALALTEKLYHFYLAQLGESHFRTARMLCRIGSCERNCNHPNRALELLERGKTMIKELPEKSDSEWLYLSDADAQIIGLLLYFYDLNKDDSLLTTAQEAAEELIVIRNRLQAISNPELKTAMGGYNALARIAVRRGQLEEAKRHIAASEAIYNNSSVAGLSSYMLNIARAELAAALEKHEDAIRYVETAFAGREKYFGTGPAGDSTTVYISMKILLGQLYEKTGDRQTALSVYRDTLESIRPLTFFQSECAQLEGYIAALDTTESETDG